ASARIARLKALACGSDTSVGLPRESWGSGSTRRPAASATIPPGQLQPDAQACGKARGEPAGAHRRLYGLDVIGHAMPGRLARRRVEDPVRRGRHTVSWLADASGVHERPSAAEVTRLAVRRPGELDPMAVVDPGDGQVGVSMQPDRRLQDLEVRLRDIA